MGLLGGILDVVAAAVLTYVTWGSTSGLLAGALLALGGAAQLGVVGGSVGSFMKSGWGEGLMAAASLGSAATALYGASAINVATTASDADSAAAMSMQVGNNGADLMGQTSTDVASQSSAIQTSNSFLSSTQTGGDAANLAAANPGAPGVTSTDPATVNGPNSAYANTSSAPAGNMQAAAAQEQNTTSAVAAAHTAQPGVPGSIGAPGAPAGADAGTAAGATSDQSAVASANAPMNPDGSPAVDQNALSNGGTNATVQPSAAAQQYGAATTQPAAAQPTSGGLGGMLKGALSGAGGGSTGISPMSAGIQAGGQIIAGVGSGIAQNEAIEKQIAAQQWGNLQWQNQSQVDQLQAAAAQPITVPQGYLQRAQAVKGMVAGNSGLGPTPGVPISPFTQAPVPPGMKAPTNTTPTGGMT
jgi:hypothetical protein